MCRLRRSDSQTQVNWVEPQHFIATEYIEGETLRQRLARGKLSLNEALDVSVQVASGLAAAHNEGIVHRDIKPENIMLRRDEYVKVLDFGLAKLIEEPSSNDTQAPTQIAAHTDPGIVMGTVRYMSPEQARGKVVDSRTDIFSLAVVLYEMIAGYSPFDGESVADVFAAILQKEPAPLANYSPGVTNELQRVVNNALRKDCNERYQTMDDLLVDLRNLRDELLSSDAGH